MGDGVKEIPRRKRQLLNEESGFGGQYHKLWRVGDIGTTCYMVLTCGDGKGEFLVEVHSQREGTTSLKQGVEELCQVGIY